MELNGIRVLVVEDEALIAMVIEEQLAELGCEVSGASRLEEAMEKAKILPLDAAVLDVNLAGMLSYPVAQILHARGVPFVFATGYGVQGLPPELSGVPVLSKPFGQQELAAALHALRAS
ncbi:MAG: response regulator [Acetobacteraceae bacterium]